MPIVIVCLSCSTRLSVSNEAIGKSVRCPKCAHVNRVVGETPAPTAASPAPVAVPPPLPNHPPAVLDLPEEEESEPTPKSRNRQKNQATNDEAVGGKKLNSTIIAVIAVGSVLLLGCCVSGVGAFFYLVKPIPTTYTKMTADELIDEWKANPSAAAKKYKFNGVQFSGTLKEINSNLGRQTYIDVRGDKPGDRALDRSMHIFVLDKEPLDGLGKCKVGQRVTIKARAEGATHDYPWLVADEIIPN